VAAPVVTAFIDANVFFGARLRSLILFVAQAGLFRPRWSNDVHREWIEAVLRKRTALRDGAQRIGEARKLVHELNVRDDPAIEDDVDGTFADRLIRDAHLACASALRFGQV
jgi:hypothetical protein